jgi:hypothetical protein
MNDCAKASGRSPFWAKRAVFLLDASGDPQALHRAVLDAVDKRLGVVSRASGDRWTSLQIVVNGYNH